MATRKQLATAVKGRLETIPNVAGYRGRPDATPPQVSDNDPRVRPYWVLHTGAGRPDDERITGDLVGVAWGFQVTAAVGDPDNLDHFVDAIVDTLHGWRPFPECSRCWTDPDYVAGTARVDEDVTPPRFWTPLIFKIQT